MISRGSATSRCEMFHQYAFATVRQAGSCFGLASVVPRLARARMASAGLARQPRRSTDVATEAKTVQFKLARMARLKRDADIAPHFAHMASSWDEGMSRLTDRFAR